MLNSDTIVAALGCADIKSSVDVELTQDVEGTVEFEEVGRETIIWRTCSGWFSKNVIQKL